MKKISILLIVLFGLVGCSLEEKVYVLQLTEKGNEYLLKNNDYPCELFIEGSKHYTNLAQVEKTKLNKLRKQSMKCKCNYVYLDLDYFLGGDSISNVNFLFNAVCTKDSIPN